MCRFQHKKFMLNIALPLLVSAFLLLAGCASTDTVPVGSDVVEAEVPDISIEEVEVDPYEGFNRKMFVFNEKLDDYVAEPVSDAYLWVTPQFVQTGIANFFNNLKDINVVLNDVMQGKVGQGAEDTGRFAVNSTVGLLGFFDVATKLGLEKHDEDFAQTLAVWGVPQGPYLVLPVLGPSTSRGVPGGIFDAAANPATYVGLPVQLVQMLNARANAEGALNFIDEAALDPYVFTRESFLQFRKHLITDGNSEITDDMLDFEDDFYDEDEISSELEMSDKERTTQISKTEVNDQEQTKGYKLKLSSDGSQFGKAADSFDGASKSFDKAARSFEQASDKINQLEQ